VSLKILPLASNILIDTTQVATDTIDYVATDTWGNTSPCVRQNFRCFSKLAPMHFSLMSATQYRKLPSAARSMRVCRCDIGPPAYCAQRPAHRPWRPHKKSPELWGPGLNVNVAASLLGQFGNDSVNLERVEERRIERDQSHAPSIRRAFRQTTWQGRLNCSAK